MAKKLKLHFDNCDDIEINGKISESNRIIQSYLEHYDIEKLKDIESNDKHNGEKKSTEKSIKWRLTPKDISS